jgi:hypothetical protein
MAKRPKSYDELATDIILNSKVPVPYDRPVEMTIHWDPDGRPTLIDIPRRISPDPVRSLQDLLKISLDMPYTGPDISLQGKSNGEAIILNLIRQAAEGSPGARSEVLDRFLGQPAQNINTTTVTGDLTNLLERVAEDMRQGRAATVVDAETIDEPDTAKSEADDL